jgi:transposase
LVLAPVSSAVLLRDDGMSYGEIARVLFLSDEGVRQQIEDYLRQNGKLQPENGGSEARLTDEQAKKLEAHLDETLYTRTRDIVEYVKETFGVAYSVRGLTKWLKQRAAAWRNGREASDRHGRDRRRRAQRGRTRRNVVRD